METHSSPPRTLEADVCIAGGGPAGMVCALLMARQGLRVVVLEKHADFHRDFRGDTIHPSTLTLLQEMGLLERFLELPHQRMPRARVAFGTTELTLADFSSLPVPCPYIALVPQWEFLDLLATAAEQLPGFTLLRSTRLDDLLIEDGQVVGAQATGPDGPLQVRSRLVIGADGRHSRVRELARLRPRRHGTAIDVLWMRLPRYPEESLPLFSGGIGALICIDRGEYWQVALAVQHGAIDQLRAEGTDALVRRIALARPELAERAGALRAEDVSELRVRVDRLPRWHRPGLLCIGDAAHAMSPAAGVGINLAVQDAVATARMLGPALREGRSPRPAELDAVRRRRLPAARLTQMVQGRVLAGAMPHGLDELRTDPPPMLRVLGSLPPARTLAARFIGLGIRPEHL